MRDGRNYLKALEKTKRTATCRGAGSARGGTPVERASSGSPLCFILQRHTQTFGHAVQRAAIDAEHFGGARTVAANRVEHVNQVAPFEFVERREILEHPL